MGFDLVAEVLRGSGSGLANAYIRQMLSEDRSREKSKVKLLAQPEKIEKAVMTTMQRLSPSRHRPATRKFGQTIDAVEAHIPDDHPFKGKGDELLAAYTANLASPAFTQYTKEEVLAGTAAGLFNLKDKEGRTPIEKAHQYKLKADTAITNWMGVFGENEDVKALPGYDIYKEAKLAKPVPYDFTEPHHSFAVGAGLAAAGQIASRVPAVSKAGTAMRGMKYLKWAGRGLVKAPHPVAKAVGAGLMMVPEFAAFEVVENYLKNTDWYKARSDTPWYKGGPALPTFIAGGAAMGATSKGLMKLISKSAEKKILHDTVRTQLMKYPAAKDAILFGETRNALVKDEAAITAGLDEVMTKGEELGKDAAFDQAWNSINNRLLRSVKKKARDKLAGEVRLEGVRSKSLWDSFFRTQGELPALSKREEYEAFMGFTLPKVDKVLADSETVGLSRAIGDMQMLKGVEASNADYAAFLARQAEAKRKITDKLENLANQRILTGVEKDRVVLTPQALKESMDRLSARRSREQLETATDSLADLLKQGSVAGATKEQLSATILKETMEGLYEKVGKSDLEKGIEYLINLDAEAFIAEVEGEGLSGAILHGKKIFVDRESVPGLYELYKAAKKVLSATGKTPPPKPGPPSGPKTVLQKKQVEKKIVEEEIKAATKVELAPLMITQQMKKDLKSAGFTDNQIRKMKPEEAHIHLKTEAQLAHEAAVDLEKGTVKEGLYTVERQTLEDKLTHIEETANGPGGFDVGDITDANNITPLKFGFGVAFLTGSMVALSEIFSPNEANAGVLGKILVPKSMAESVIKGGEKVAKDIFESGYSHIKLPTGDKVVNAWQEVPKYASAIADERGNLTRAVKSVGKKMPSVMSWILSPSGLGEIHYKPAQYVKGVLEKMAASPVPHIANLAAAIGNNVRKALQVVDNILAPIKAIKIQNASKAIIDAMGPLAERSAADVTAYRTAEMKAATADKAIVRINKLLAKDAVKKGKRLSKKKLEAIQKGIVFNTIELAKSQKAITELKPAFERYLVDHEVLMKDLANRYATTRVALAVEDTVTFTKRKWLAEMLSPEEKEAASYLRELMGEYATRIKGVKGRVISDPYIHHVWHPKWNTEAAAKKLDQFDIRSGAIPFTKIFQRAKYSRLMIPDISYVMQKYIPDIERRIQWKAFWGKGEKNSWWAHRRSPVVKLNSKLNDFWSKIEESSRPPADTKWNILANRYAAFEVARLLWMSPSVAFKHYFKNIGTIATMGPKEFTSHFTEAWAMAMRNSRQNPGLQRLYRGLGIKTETGKGRLYDEVVNGLITQEHRMNMIADLELDSVRNIPGMTNRWDKFMRSFNNIGSIPVRVIEAVDRHHTVIAAMEMAHKRGMTVQQAMYGIYDNILRNNFLSGSLNPAWVRNPKIRSLFLFQNTAYKIFERRALTAMRAGRDLKTTFGTLRKEDWPTRWKQIKEFGAYISSAEKEMKQSMIYDALTASKDVFGTPAIKQAMTEIIWAGAIMSAGGAVGLNFHPQLLHMPFFVSGRSDPTIAVNPFVQSFMRTTAQREMAEEYDIDKEFFITAWMQNMFRGTGVMPQTIRKVVRLSENDIPELYKNSMFKYFFAIPATK